MASVLVVGGANLDIKARTNAPLIAGTSNPGRTALAPGGVGRNVAENLARLGDEVRLVSAVGDDPLGDLVLDRTAAAGVDVSGVRRVKGTTGTYTAVLDHGGELVAGIADMAAADAVTVDAVDVDGDLVVVDGNLRPDVVAELLDRAQRARVPVVIDPVSVPKAALLTTALTGRELLAITPNVDELAALGGVDALHRLGARLVWVRRGRDGSTLSGPEGSTELTAATAEEVVDVTGAGDAMLAAFCHALLAGDEPVSAARLGHVAAALTVASVDTVRPDLTDDLLRSHLS